MMDPLNAFFAGIVVGGLLIPWLMRLAWRLGGNDGDY